MFSDAFTIIAYLYTTEYRNGVMSIMYVCTVDVCPMVV